MSGTYHFAFVSSSTFLCSLVLHVNDIRDIAEVFCCEQYFHVHLDHRLVFLGVDFMINTSPYSPSVTLNYYMISYAVIFVNVNLFTRLPYRMELKYILKSRYVKPSFSSFFAITYCYCDSEL